MKMSRLAVAVLASVAMGGAHAALTEGFDSVQALQASGWVMTNNSAPVGSAWFQGNAGAFSSQSGAADSYVAANFLSTPAVSGVIDNWLISPALMLTGGSTLSFYARTPEAGFSDAFQVLFSESGSSATASFTTLLLNVASPTIGWSQYSVALPDTSSGRFAFRYSVGDASTANYIGIDTVNVAAVPEPTTLALFGLGLAAVGAMRRRAAAP